MRSVFGKRRSDGLVEVSGRDGRHLSLVLRKAPGDILNVTFEDGMTASCRIESICEGTVILSRMEDRLLNIETRRRFVLIQALPKGQKMDFIIEKCTELGFYAIQPVVSERCVAREASDGKLARWRAIAKEAAKQSGRTAVPEVGEIIPLLEAIDAAQARRAFIAVMWEHEKEKGLLELAGAIRGADEIVLVIGPEGGFSNEEVRSCIAKGAVTVSLGPRILRAETAPVAAGAAMMCLAGETEPRIE